jgi:hypothetical protein
MGQAGLKSATLPGGKSGYLIAFFLKKFKERVEDRNNHPDQ